MSLSPVFDPARALTLARETLDIEVGALVAMSQRLDERFGQAVALVLQSQGRVVVMGMGKSGHVGRKIAAAPWPPPARRRCLCIRPKPAMVTWA